MKYFLLLCLTLGFAYAGAQEKAPAAATEAPKKKIKGKELSYDIDFAPKNLVLAAKPGYVATGKIIVKNTSNREFDVEFVSKEFALKEQQTVNKKTKTVLIPLPQVDLKNVVVSPQIIKLKPKASQEVNISIKVPEDAKEETFFKYSFRPTTKSRSQKPVVPGKDQKDTAVSFNVDLWLVGKLIPLGTEKYSLSFEKNEISYDKSTKKLNLEAAVRNSSNTHLEAVTGIAVILKDNKKLGNVDYKTTEVSQAFFPKMKKNYSARLGIELKPGEYTVVTNFMDAKNKVVQTVTKKFSVK